MPVIKPYECLTCGAKEEKVHPSMNDTEAPICPVNQEHGPMNRVFTTFVINGVDSGKNKDWMAGRSPDNIAGILANEYDP